MAKRRGKKSSESRYELGRAAVYSRVSNPGDAREASLETQETAIIARLRELGYECDESDIFRDKFTGKETIRRPYLNKMREAVRSGVYKAVGVYKLDRLSRNMGQTFILLNELDDLNVLPVSVVEPSIDDSAQGKMYRMMGGYMAEMELANLEDRFGRGKEYIAARGQPLGTGTPKYGYLFDKRRRAYLIDEDRPDDGHEGTARWLRLIFRLMAEGLSAHKVRQRLNAMSVPPPSAARRYKFAKPKSGLWSARAVAAVVKDPAYKGWCIEGRHYSEGITDAGHSILRRVPEDEWVIHDKTGAIRPRLIADEEWEAANQTLRANALNRRSFGKGRNVYLLRGMVRCLACGGKRYGFVNRHGRTLYRCENYFLKNVEERGRERCTAPHVQGSWLEGLVWGELHRVLVTPGRLEAAVRACLADTGSERLDADLEAARAALAAQEKVRDRLFAKMRAEMARDEPDEELVASWERDFRATRGLVDSMRKAAGDLEAELAIRLNPARVAADLAAVLGPVRARMLVGEDFSLDEQRAALELVRCQVACVGDGRRSDRAGGSGECHFYLPGLGNELEPSPARCSRLVAFIVARLGASG